MYGYGNRVFAQDKDGLGGKMPRISTKRGSQWGTGVPAETPWLTKTLNRVKRSEKWRKARNERKRMNKAQ
jgi:hypothetical protein